MKTRRKFPLIRIAKNGRLVVCEDWTSPKTITVDRRRQPDSTDNEYWWIRGAKLSRAAATKLRDQLTAWLEAKP